MWHASLARWSRTAPIAVERWGDGLMRDAKRRAQETLAGVGQEPTVLSKTPVAIHLRRSLTDAELASISTEWLALPARDAFSEAGEIEMQL